MTDPSGFMQVVKVLADILLTVDENYFGYKQSWENICALSMNPGVTVLATTSSGHRIGAIEH